jgi:Zn-dependent protease with chaperone function
MKYTRAPVPLVIVPGPMCSAAYFGLWRGRRRIEVQTHALTKLSKDELTALVSHEVGHYQLWHVERHVMMILLTVLGTLWLGYTAGDPLGALTYLAGMLFFTKALRCVAELEADQYARLKYGPEAVLRMLSTMVSVHPTLRNGWLFRLRCSVAEWHYLWHLR